MGEIAQEMRVVSRERGIWRDDKRFHSLECVYARGDGIEAPGEIFCVCGVCVGMCGCEKIMRRGGRGYVTA